MDEKFGCELPEEEAVCTSTSEEEKSMFGPLTPYDPIPKKYGEGVSPLLVERYGFGRRCDVYSPVNYGGKATYTPPPTSTPTTSRGTYRTQPRPGTYVSQPAGTPARGTYGVPGGQAVCPPPSGGRLPPPTNRGTYGVPSTPQSSQPAQVAAEILAKFQSSCGKAMEQLKSLEASTPSSGRGGLPSTPGSGGTYNISGSSVCPSPAGTYNISGPLDSTRMSGYNASVSGPSSGGGFSPPQHRGGCPSSPTGTYDISTDVVSPVPYPKTPVTANCPRPPRSRLPAPPSGKTGTCGQPCPSSADEPGPGNTNVVKPNLEDLLDLMQFGMNSFLEKRNCALHRLKCNLEMNQGHLEEGMGVLEGMNGEVCSDLAPLPALIESWNSHAKHLRDLHTQSTDPNNPTPNLSLIKHPSACINQQAYSELLKSGMHLCQEVERGLRMEEIFYGKLDEIMEKARGAMIKAYNSLCLVEDSRGAMTAEAQEWMRRFKETEHSINNFLCEWQKGGDHLDKPVPETCPPPILNLEELVAQQTDPIPCGDADNSLATYVEPNNSKASEETKTPGCPPSIQRLQEEASSSDQGLQSLIQRFNSMNSSIHQEVQQNMDQQQVLNESLRAMEDIQTPPAPPPASA